MYRAVEAGNGTVENRFDVTVNMSDNGFTVSITDRETGKTYSDRAGVSDNENVTAKAERYTASMIRNIKRGMPESTSRSTAGIYIPKGEMPVRDVNVPVFDENGDKVRRFMRTVLESGAIPDDMVPEIKDNIIAGAASYTPISNKSAMAYADAVMQNQLSAQAEWDRAKITLALAPSFCYNPYRTEVLSVWSSTGCRSSLFSIFRAGSPARYSSRAAICAALSAITTSFGA